MGTLILIINLIAVAWFITQAENFLEEINQILKNWKRIFKIPIKIISCIKCASFWLTISWTQDFVLACQVSLFASLLDKYLLSSPIKLK